ncbi:hypothetical protein [Acinetobacter larvae]|uniref:N-acetyltransferase domain-containing protein n=1 Tax=Acinetobacter larvae TaxID=1789224 RepID=A0A1B2LYU2_9GAMM|nr:hypothetical protein [Acinetobacter larvae]AOA58059.1 hypothetical protein BFG52_06645 [Acinetobacter larvae]
MMNLQQNIYFRSPAVPDLVLRSAEIGDDAQLLEVIKEVMPSNRMSLSFERVNSYLSASTILGHTRQCLVIVKETRPDQILGMFLLAWKQCGTAPQHYALCYICDLRFRKELRGKRNVRLIMDYLAATFPQHNFYQSIILADNVLARKVFHVTREHYFSPYIWDNIYTYNISHFKAIDLPHYLNVVPLEEGHIDAVLEFLADLQQYYNFLTIYDFKNIHTDQKFWQGLSYNDFYIVVDESNQIVGLYGLWDQKHIKRIRVLDYHYPLKLVKPLYNLYATLCGKMTLPKVRQCFEYLLMQGPFCSPHRADVFEFMLHHAMQSAKAQNHQILSLSLAENDPRRYVMEQATAEIIHAIHSLHSFQADPTQYFDRQKISYIDVARI